jgi:serine phosphatase RsbU (regulator of sigma subunit)
VARYRPGRHQALLGGDFYDVVERADGALFLLIGDVAGHGPDEAALGVCLRIAWRTLVLAGVDPETILPSMAAVLVSERSSEELFATVTMVRVDAERSAARFWLAGHPWPLLIDRDQVSSLPVQATGIALGIDDTETWVATDLAVDRSDRLLLFTDGLVEG